MPWCESCSKYLTPTALNTDGTCPTCARAVGEVDPRADEVLAEESTPWHFKLLIGAVAVYLAWRAVQMVNWLF